MVDVEINSDSRDLNWVLPEKKSEHIATCTVPFIICYFEL